MRAALDELTTEAKGLDPFDAYIRLRERVVSEPGLGIEDYCSSSITSGGHARDESLDMGQVIARNTKLALDICDELYGVGQLNPKTAVEAVMLGKLPWKQSDYMTFWLSTMAGLPSGGHGILQTITDFREDLDVALRSSDTLDMEMYDSKAPAEERAPHYFEHASIFAAIARQYDAQPVGRLVRLVDPDMSLGAQTENVFARLMGTNVFKVGIAEIGEAGPSEANMPRQLVADTQRLIRFGATIFDTLKRQQLVLVPQPA